ncbi:hypothetical protein BGP_6522 [Beggiatoa sp. PS]|nr:hypothetical protein BGP_6522 [Beggiatoa sp. PS]
MIVAETTGLSPNDLAALSS